MNPAEESFLPQTAHTGNLERGRRIDVLPSRFSLRAQLENSRKPQMIDALPARLRVLSVGDDQDLLSTRQLVLESAGYQVQSVSSFAVIEEGELVGFDLVLICHSVESARTDALISFLRGFHPSLQIIHLSEVSARLIRGVHSIASSRPEDLLREMRRVFFTGTRQSDGH